MSQTCRGRVPGSPAPNTFGASMRFHTGGLFAVRDSCSCALAQTSRHSGSEISSLARSSAGSRSGTNGAISYLRGEYANMRAGEGGLVQSLRSAARRRGVRVQSNTAEYGRAAEDVSSRALVGRQESVFRFWADEIRGDTGRYGEIFRF